MEVRRMLGDDAYVEYDMTAGLCEVGDRLLPGAMHAVIPSEDGLPAVRLAIAVHDGVPVCRRVEVDATPDGRDIRQADLNAISIDLLVERVCSAVAVQVVTRNADGEAGKAVWEWNNADAVEQARRAMQRARTGRPVRLSDERIRKAAEVYRAHVDSRPTEAVAAAFGIAHRTASKYVTEARTRGFLPPTTPGKKQA